MHVGNIIWLKREVKLFYRIQKFEERSYMWSVHACARSCVCVNTSYLTTFNRVKIANILITREKELMSHITD